MALGKLGWREMRKRPGRAALTLASVVIGVAAVVSVTLTTQSTRRAFADIFKSMAGRADLEVAAPIGSTIEETLLATVDGTPGVEAAAPLIQRQTVLYAKGKRVQTSVMGIDPARDKAVHNFALESGQSLAEANGIMVNSALAGNLGIGVGDRVELLTRSGRMKAKVVGLYKSGTTAISGQGASLLVPLRTAQSWFKAPRRLDSIQIVLAPEAEEARVQAALEERLPKDAPVRRPAARSATAQETALATEQALQMARAFSVLVAVFVITNTFMISVTQRRRQFGIMRAIGATRKQIAGMVYRQALTLGFFGTILGALLGVVAANFLTQAMGSLYETSLPPIQITVEPFLWAALFGMGISFVGAALPSYKAAHLSPLDAIRDVLAEEIEGVSHWFTWGGTATVAFSGTVMAASILGYLKPEHAVWSGVLLLVGLVLLLPLALEPLSRFVAALAPRGMKTESKLASRHLLIHRSRTTLTVGVVFIAASSAIGLSSTVLDNIADVKQWYGKTIIADFFVRAGTPDMATGLTADLPDGIGEKIESTPGVETIEGIRLVGAQSGDQRVILIVRSFDDSKLQAFDIASGDAAHVRENLNAGQVVLGSVFAQRAGLKVGDEAPLKAGEGEKKFRVAAVANDYQAGGLTMYMDRAIAERELGVGGVDAYAVKADHDRLPEVRKSLEQLGAEDGLLIQSFSDIQREIDMMIAGVDAGLWGMVVLGLIVATFGVANTLTMTVLEQTFELGLLRVIAATRAQVRKMIVAQAVIMGLLALVPGIIAGVGVAYLIHLATMPVIGHPVEFTLRPLLMLGGLAGGLLVVLIAAWPPAERAARIELTATLKLK
jgi:putative ABC transport system permease protein